MPTFFNVQGSKWGLGRSGALVLALLLVYVVWGTTYFAIGIALQSMPPLWMNAIRFLCAGGVMLLVALWQGHTLPSVVQWRNAALVGALMVFGAMNCVGLAQKLGIGSGLMATVVTTMPMWLALWTRWGGERVPLTSWVGLALGVVGALLLALEGDFSATWQGALFAFGAPLCWSVGSYASRKLTLPAPAMAAAAQWLVGGALCFVVAAWMEPVGSLAHVSAKSWAAWVYLVVFGTLIALNAYLWLLQNASAALAGSYSFVNPAVALLVGVALGGELLTGWVFAALPLIAGALVCILYGPLVLGLWQRNVCFAMLYKFKSRAAADLILLEPQGRQILQIIGKAPAPNGIVTAAQIPAALAALEAAVAADEARLREAAQQAAEADPNAPEDEPRDTVRLRQRAAPFIDLLRRSLQEDCDVVWGV
eukprot:gene11233-11035_t